MDRIIFPRLQFVDASLEEAIDFLRLKSRDLDTTETDPAKKGVSFVLNTGDMPVIGAVNIDLTDVSMSDALLCIVNQIEMKYTVTPYAVLISPFIPSRHTYLESYQRTKLYQHIFRVPPDFLALAFGDAPAEPADPFTPSPAEDDAVPPPPKTVIDILNKHGIMFFDGTFAVYDKATSQLLVRGHPVMLEQVEASLEEARQKAEPQQQAK